MHIAWKLLVTVRISDIFSTFKKLLRDRAIALGTYGVIIYKFQNHRIVILWLGVTITK